MQRLFRRHATTIAARDEHNAVTDVTVHDAMTFPRTTDVSVELCMISTADGVTDVSGRSGPLGSDADREVLLTLRDNADVVLVGAGTVRAEHYGVPRRSPIPIVVVSKRCDLDWTSPLFTSGWGMVATTTNAPHVPVRSFRAGKNDVDIQAIITALHNDLNARVIHVEGGPMLNSALLLAGCVDAINLTIAPHIGCGGTTITSAFTQPDFNNQRFHIAQLCRDGDYLFVRYERAK